MDTSETYIKMCEKAEEIQAHKGYDQIAVGGYVFFGLGESHYISISIGIAKYLDLAEVDYSKDDIIWLPRQDQLQELLQWSETWWSLNNRFTLWIKEQSIRFLYLHNSGEQLWLAFVMKEQYQKVWDGEDWQREQL